MNFIFDKDDKESLIMLLTNMVIKKSRHIECYQSNIEIIIESNIPISYFDLTFLNIIIKNNRLTSEGIFQKIEHTIQPEDNESIECLWDVIFRKNNDSYRLFYDYRIHENKFIANFNAPLLKYLKDTNIIQLVLNRIEKSSLAYN